MKFSIASITLLVSAAAGHMIMVDPPQWKVPGEAAGPLDPSGADYPCANGVAESTASRTYTAGGTAKLQVQGSAVHGGGSGQMVITYDFPPTSKSVWRVLQSFEGDHPIKAAGNFPADPTLSHPAMDWSVPAGLPSGRAVVAWTWFNRIGNREMYMKCSTVNIAGVTATSSDLNNDPGMLALPTMFRANSGNGCAVPEGVDAILFKNPGTNPIVKGGYAGTSIACDSSEPGNASSGSASSGSGSSGSGSSGNGGAAPENTPVASTGATPTETEAAATTTTELNTVATETATKTRTRTRGGRPTPTGSDQESSSGNDVEVGPIPTTLVTKTAAATKTPTPAPESGSSSSGRCPEGKVYCNADGTWSQCGSGYIQNMGKVPGGMQCAGGQFGRKTKSRRSFSGAHRHHARHVKF